MRLALRFTLGFYAVMCVAFAANAYLRVNREIAFLNEDIERDNRIIGQAILRAFRSIWETESEANALQFIDEIRTRKVENAAAADGDVDVNWVWRDACGGDPRAPLAPPEMVARSWDKNWFTCRDFSLNGTRRLAVYLPFSPPNSREGAIEVSESLTRVQKYVVVTIHRTIYTTIALVLVCGVAALAMGLWWVGLPIQRLIHKTQRVAAGDLAEPLELRPGNELAMLARAFNTMCDRLEEMRQKLLAETTARVAALDGLRAADRLRTVGTLASGIAHELGTPLNVVQARAKMIACGEVTGKEAASNASIIAEQSKRMTAIVRQLLDFAKPRGPKKSRLDIVQLARDTITLFAPIAKKKHVELEQTDDGLPLAANADQDQLQHALANLITNGMQAMPEGGKVTVHCSRVDRRAPAEQGEREGAYACVAVRDEGLGITEEQKTHIFEPFFSTKPRGEGTGLGLSIAYSIAREHGGWIEFESTVGQGACFFLYVPREIE